MQGIRFVTQSKPKAKPKKDKKKLDKKKLKKNLPFGTKVDFSKTARRVGEPAAQRSVNWQRSALDERLLAARTFGGSKLAKQSSSSDSEDDATEPASTDFGYKLQNKKKKKKKKKDKSKSKSKEDKKKHKKQKKHKKEKKEKKHKKQKKHKKSKKSDSAGDDESEAIASSASVPAGRMDWMMAVPKRTTSAPALSKEEQEEADLKQQLLDKKKAQEEAKEKKLQDEIDRGERCPETGTKYGLYFPKGKPKPSSEQSRETADLGTDEFGRMKRPRSSNRDTKRSRSSNHDSERDTKRSRSSNHDSERDTKRSRSSNHDSERSKRPRHDRSERGGRRGGGSRRFDLSTQAGREAAMEAAKRRWQAGPSKQEQSDRKSKFDALLAGKGGGGSDKLAKLAARKRQDREDSKYDAMLASSVMRAGGGRGGGGGGGGRGVSMSLDDDGGGGGMLDAMERKLQAAREKESGASRRRPAQQPQTSGAKASKANLTALQILRAKLMGKKGGGASTAASEVDKTPWRKNLPYKPKDKPVKARTNRPKMVFGRAEGEAPSLESLERKLEYQRRKAEEEVTVVTPLDAKGRLISSLAPNRPKYKKGSIEELVQMEREGRGAMSDFDANFARNVMRGRSGRGDVIGVGLVSSRSGADEDEDMQRQMKMWMDKGHDKKLDPDQQRERDMRRAVSAGKRWETANDRRTKERQRYKHLMLSLGNETYLQLAPTPISEGHCQIIPLKHCWSATEADEGVQREIALFKDALRSMHRKEGRGMVFLETVIGTGRKERYHTRIECVPLPQEEAADSSIHFRKAIEDKAEEWSTHNKIIKTTGKTIQRSIPANFPYFHVEWTSPLCKEGGFAHVIEDESKFSRNSDFGTDVLLGMLGLNPRMFNRKKKRQSRQAQGIAVKNFLESWKIFDWTQKLDGGQYS